MHLVRGSRSEHLDLLAPPLPVDLSNDRLAALLIDPVAQVAELADLVDRGLVTLEEFEQQRRKMFGA